jgi:hypothetical protein
VKYHPIVAACFNGVSNGRPLAGVKSGRSSPTDPSPATGFHGGVNISAQDGPTCDYCKTRVWPWKML